MSNFLEQIYHEINITKSREDVEIPLSAIGFKKTKIETMLVNLNKYVNKSDIAYIDYTKGGHPNNSIQPLNHLFCDNIIIYSPIDNNLFVSLHEDIKLDKIAKGILPIMTANIKNAFTNLGLEIKKNQIKPTRIKDISNESYLSKTSQYIQMVKVDLDKIEVNKIFSTFSDPMKIKYLADNNIFINDIDFTQDFSGVINKENVIKHLLSRDDFRLQGSSESAEHTILDNDFKISKNCLTFIKHTNNGDVRFKFYNKFIQSLESPSVRGQVGSHLGDYISNPNLDLKQAIKKAKDTGILRLEITFYRHATDKHLSESFVLDNMRYLQELLPNNLVYHNSIENQFNLVCDNIVHNVCIYNTNFETALVSLFHNSLTSKTNGFFLTKINTTNISNALKYFCSNKPIIFLIMSIDFDNNNVSIQHDSYLRLGTNLSTYICNSDKCSFSILKDNQPEDVGIIENDTFKFILPKKSLNLSSKNNINFKKIETNITTYPTTSLRMYNKIAKENFSVEEFEKQTLEKLQEIERERIEMNKIREEQRQLEINRDILKQSLKSKWCEKLTDFENGTIIYVYALKEINTQYGQNFSVIGSLENHLNKDTTLFQFWSNSYLNSIINVASFKKLDFKNIIAYGSISGNPIITLVKKYNFTTKSNHTAAHIEINNLIDNANENSNLPNNTLEELLSNVTTKSCTLKIDEIVKENDIIVVKGYRKLAKSLILKLKFNVNEDENYFIASPFLKELAIKKIEKEIHFKVIAGPFKTTAQKKSARTYFTP